uniref:SLIT and NTRK like family member 2 n=1 Tax=Callorhinchus milii TaxID=7868 RepID=A0A4W3IEU4_CALMI
MLSCVLVVSAFAVTTGFSSRSPAESRKAAKDICRNRCVCEDKENVLNINCENKGFTSLRLFHAPHHRVSQLFFNGNSLSRLPPNSFANFSQAVTLHLGDNGLQDIRVGAFQGLRTLKRLHLNNNNLEVLREETFLGLESLEYLQADYNYIAHIEPGTFGKLTKLKVLILNDNLLPSLPGNVFRFVLLTHLDLRGNRLRRLPFAGVLEHVGGIMEIQLEENPWNCTCELMPLRAWLDTVPFFVGEMVCETPFRLHGQDVTQLHKQDLCPRKSPVDSNLRVPQPPDSRWPRLPGPPATPTPSPAKRPTPRVPKDRQIFGPIMVYQTKSPAPVVCPDVCSCSLQASDNGLNVHCHERSIINMSQLQPRPSQPKKLYLTGNLLHTVRLGDLETYSGSLELLHLGNNRISAIQEGAFGNLTHLRRLYLNGNHIERLSPAIFEGLKRLQYLYLESNVIKDILRSTFHSLANLHLLYLNNNLLRSLPISVFAGTNLTRLNLRNNHFSHLPVKGVLDQLSAFVQIDLQENPWDCSCKIIALKNWMEQPSASIVVNEITCESPARFAGKLLRPLRNEDICPEHSDIIAATIVAVTYSSDAAQSNSQSPSPGPAQSSAVPLSVLILGLLVVFILSVCFGAGLFVFVLKRRKGGQSAHNSTANNLDLSSYQLQYGSYNFYFTDV